MSSLERTCTAIIDGYEAELCGLDDKMVVHLIELGDQAELILKMRTLFLKSYAAWEDEEDSVKEEHADLISAMSDVVERL